MTVEVEPPPSTPPDYSDDDKPGYHVMPRTGWLNDPNGPIYHKGRYHIFYQHVVGSSQWDWACSWAHASSADLARWRHEPVALVPTAASLDAAGCWSGCSALDTEGTPVILYTGVRLRNKPGGIPLPPAASDLGLEMIESQCAAVCQPGDDGLVLWTKRKEPLIEFPPAQHLVGFRDPYIIQRGDGAGKPWKMIVGSGVKGQGGTLLLYTSDTLLEGWQYQGIFTEGKSRPCDDWDLGEMWECPFFVELPDTVGCGDTQAAEKGRCTGAAAHVLCISPYPHYRKDRPTNPCLYWIGACEWSTFNVEAAEGPFRLDLGDVLYAPNAFIDPLGRTLMLAWLQELRSGGTYKYAGCLSVPRVLMLQGGRLHQEPAPELAQLRSQDTSFVSSSGLAFGPEDACRMPEVGSPRADVSFTLRRGASSAAGLLLRAWLHPADDGAEATAAALVMDWERRCLEVVFFTRMIGALVDWESAVKSVGGPVYLEEAGKVQLRVLMDHSVVEVFTGSGQALSTRVYRGQHSDEGDPGLFFVARGGRAGADDIAAFAMGSIW